MVSRSAPASRQQDKHGPVTTLTDGWRGRIAPDNDDGKDEARTALAGVTSGSNPSSARRWAYIQFSDRLIQPIPACVR
jgi:hypothetical protein